MMADPNIHLGANVARLRLEAGLSQERLAEDIGRSRQEVVEYERGARVVGAAIAWTISQALGVSVDHLFQFLPEAASADSDALPLSS
jgi:transcriptional regulator with XRE-family HTH domain